MVVCHHIQTFIENIIITYSPILTVVKPRTTDTYKYTSFNKKLFRAKNNVRHKDTHFNQSIPFTCAQWTLVYGHVLTWYIRRICCHNAVEWNTELFRQTHPDRYIYDVRIFISWNKHTWKPSHSDPPLSPKAKPLQRTRSRPCLFAVQHLVMTEHLTVNP